jgi:hypothetical protein
VVDDSSVGVPIACRHCRAALTVEVDRWHADLQLRQEYTCPACAKRSEGVFPGRVVRVTRRWDTE